MSFKNGGEQYESREFHEKKNGHPKTARKIIAFLARKIVSFHIVIKGLKSLRI